MVWDKRLRSQRGAPQSGRPLPFPSSPLLPSPSPAHASSFYLLSPLPHAESVPASGYDWNSYGAQVPRKGRASLAQGHGEVLRGGSAGASWKGGRACQTHAGADVSGRTRAGRGTAACFVPLTMTHRGVLEPTVENANLEELSDGEGGGEGRGRRLRGSETFWLTRPRECTWGCRGHPLR